MPKTLSDVTLRTRSTASSIADTILVVSATLHALLAPVARLDVFPTMQLSSFLAYAILPRSNWFDEVPEEALAILITKSFCRICFKPSVFEYSILFILATPAFFFSWKQAAGLPNVRHSIVVEEARWLLPLDF